MQLFSKLKIRIQRFLRFTEKNYRTSNRSKFFEKDNDSAKNDPRI